MTEIEPDERKQTRMNGDPSRRGQTHRRLCEG
jgi:hypothetical protein